MNDNTVKSWALGFAIVAFGFLTFGSVLFGARVTTALIRGVSGGLLFGALLWLVGSIVVKEEFVLDEPMLGEDELQDMEGSPNSGDSDASAEE